jgi:aryl-alcohol dehydrogenase-like predicted oxidoreductase
MERRALGKTGAELSIVGFGGIVVMDVEPAEASRLVSEAVDRGVNYFDVAPSYGNAEERLGPALQPHRERVFLACKTGKRDRQGAADELRASLGRLRTDRFDLYQLHAISSMEDVDQALGPGGAIETFVEARDQGLIRHIGFSAHSVEAALSAMDRFPFDSILFPTNYVLYHQAGFGPQVVERAEQLGVGRLALKAMARTQWREGQPRSFTKTWYEPISDPEEAALALRFTLSQPITAAIPPGEASLFSMALRIAEQFRPLEAAELDELERRARALQPIFRLAA